MPCAAPRLDPRLVSAVSEIDDGVMPIAEVSRRVGARALSLGLTRPSYVHLRRLVRAERERRRELHELRADVLDGIARHSPVDAAVIAERISEIEGRKALRARA